MEKQKLIVPKTRCLQQEAADMSKDPLDLFAECPYKEGRDLFLQRIKDGTRDIGPLYADWAEACITQLVNNGLDDWDYAKKILNWYVFACEQDELVVRALEFAISLNHERITRSPFNLNVVSKEIAGKLLNGRHIKLYSKVPSLQKFLCKIFDNLTYYFGDARSTKKEYLDMDWYPAKRALQIILSAEDFSFLQTINQIIAFYGENLIGPASYSLVGTKDRHLAEFKITRKHLRKAQKHSKRGKSLAA